MRTVLNISIPPAAARELKREAKAGGFASTSEYFRHILREWRSVQLAKELKSELAEFHAGKARKLRSLRDLVD